MELKENLSLVITYDGYLPGIAELRGLAQRLKEMIAQQKENPSEEGKERLKWDLSILQQAAGLSDLAALKTRFPASITGKLIEDWSKLSDQ